MDTQSAHAHACKVRTAIKWAARQRKIVVKTCVASQRDRFVPWITVFGEQGDEDAQIDNIDDFVGKFYASLVSFTADAPNRIVRNSGERNGLEAWRRLHGEYDSTSSMRRGDTAASSEPSSMPTCRRLGICSGRLALEETSVRDVHGQERTDSLVAAMFRLMPKSLEETVMFTNEDQEFDGLLTHSSRRQSVKMSTIKRQNRRDDPMDV